MTELEIPQVEELSDEAPPWPSDKWTRILFERAFLEICQAEVRSRKGAPLTADDANGIRRAIGSAYLLGGRSVVWAMALRYRATSNG